MPPKSTTIDEFLSRLGTEQRAALEQLRRDIHAAAAGLEEVISYGVPGFKLGGRLLVSIGAGASHCAFYPGAMPIARHARELERYDTSKGTIRFAPTDPLPSSLVATIVQSRVAENAARASATKKGKAQGGAAERAKPKRAPAKAAKRPAKRATTKRSTAKRSGSKRSGSKRAGAKRTTAKRATSKRATAKRGSKRRG